MQGQCNDCWGRDVVPFLPRSWEKWGNLLPGQALCKCEGGSLKDGRGRTWTVVWMVIQIPHRAVSMVEQRWYRESHEVSHRKNFSNLPQILFMVACSRGDEVFHWAWEYYNEKKVRGRELTKAWVRTTVEQEEKGMYNSKENLFGNKCDWWRKKAIIPRNSWFPLLWFITHSLKILNGNFQKKSIGF